MSESEKRERHVRETDSSDNALHEKFEKRQTESPLSITDTLGPERPITEPPKPESPRDEGSSDDGSS